MRRSVLESKNRKGMSGSMLHSIMIVFAVAVIVGILVFNITSDERDDIITRGISDCNATETSGCGYEYNSTLSADAGSYKIFSNLDLVGLAVAFGVVLTIIFKVVANRKNVSF